MLSKTYCSDRSCKAKVIGHAKQYDKFCCFSLFQFLHDMMAEAEANLTETQVHLQDLLQRHEVSELKTTETINKTWMEATRLIGLLEYSVDRSFAAQTQRLDNLMGISEAFEANQSSHQQEISSLVRLSLLLRFRLIIHFFCTDLQPQIYECRFKSSFKATASSRRFYHYA